MTVVRLLARPMLAVPFLVNGAHALRKPEAQIENAQPIADRLVPAAKRLVPQAPIPEDTKTLVRINGAAQVAGGLMLATGRFPRLAAMTLAGTIVPTTLAGHRFWEADESVQRTNQLNHFIKNVGLLGGLLLAGVDTEGRPGVVWRAQHAAKATRREAKRARKTAKRETKLAGKRAKAGLPIG